MGGTMDYMTPDEMNNTIFELEAVVRKNEYRLSWLHNLIVESGHVELASVTIMGSDEIHVVILGYPVGTDLYDAIDLAMSP